MAKSKKETIPTSYVLDNQGLIREEIVVTMNQEIIKELGKV